MISSRFPVFLRISLPALRVYAFIGYCYKHSHKNGHKDNKKFAIRILDRIAKEKGMFEWKRNESDKYSWYNKLTSEL